MTPRELLQRYWQHSAFRPMQEAVINSVVSGKDTLAIMPTGGGKSICFQIPSMMLPGICIVVTPLIALMKDQVLNLKARGIFALAIHSGMKFFEVKQTLENAAYGNFKFLYVSPERLETDLFLEYLPLIKVNLIAVDEAHCISQWGYDFRPSYLKIASLREAIPDIPTIALTASATKRVQKDICEKLNFRSGYQVFTQSYERANLSYSVFSPPSKENKLVEIIRKVDGSSIVYCKSRRRTKEIAQLLTIRGISADFYHAGLTSDERNKRQDDWMQDKTRVICCTNAFGMGIDKPNVRTVVHFEIPDALEYYYQEAGRAGRDGRKAFAVLLFHKEEILDLQNQVAVRFPDLATIRNVFGAICNFIGLPAGKGVGQSFGFEISSFIEKFKLNPLVTTSVIKILQEEGYFILSDQFFSPSTVEFTASRNTLENLEADYEKYTPVVKGLLRSYEGIFDQECIIDEFILARFVAMDRDIVIQYLEELDQRKILKYTPRTDLPQLYFLVDRPEANDLFVNEKNLKRRKEAYEKRLLRMISYTTESNTCRSVFINRYFDGKPVPPCGICDICINGKQRAISPADFERTLSVVQQEKKLNIEQLQLSTKLSKERLLDIIEFLKDENEILIDRSGDIVLRKIG